MSVINFPLMETQTVEQALAVASRDHASIALDKVLVVGVYPDGELYLASSRMTCAEALWLAERAKQYSLNPFGGN